MKNSRRHFFRQSTAVTLGFLGLDRYLCAAGAKVPRIEPWGPLGKDPHRILNLPEGFSYRVLSRTGDRMSDGYLVPGKPDGMAAFPGEGDRVVLVRNHELSYGSGESGPFKDNGKLPKNFESAMCYDPGKDGEEPFLGGTSNLVFDPATGEVEGEFLSLFGTDRNCAGGPTPWGSWITCEEPGDLVSERGLGHGYCFEVPAGSEPRLTQPEPLKAMGRFRHEAIAVHPHSGAVYLTEDRGDGLIYRFLPAQPGQLQAGGKLQALRIRDRKSADTRTWPGDAVAFPLRQRYPVDWMDLEEIDAPLDDLRLRGFAAGAARFSRGEGMWYGSKEQVGEEAIYWACTDGGAIQNGQIFRYFPSPLEGQSGESEKPGELELFLEPNDTDLLKNGDNICIAPAGDLVICEDTGGVNSVRGVTPSGEFYTIAENAISGSEFCGACFSPDGRWLFVNIQTPGITLAVTGPWRG
jgi:secreted PhoX family phosphatase